MADDGPRIIELGRGVIEKPSDSPRQGDRRIVRLLPTPYNTYAPCLWRSPFMTTEGQAKGRWCVVLLDKGDSISRPKTAAMFVPEELWDKLPQDVVEW